MICKQHPKYKALKKPTTKKNCDCMRIWKEKQLETENVKKVAR